jgi:hypothetical protein
MSTLGKKFCEVYEDIGTRFIKLCQILNFVIFIGVMCQVRAEDQSKAQSCDV